MGDLELAIKQCMYTFNITTTVNVKIKMKLIGNV